MKASLLRCLSVHGKQAKIGAILKHRGYGLTCTVPTAGTLAISWLKKPVTVATGKKVLRKPGSMKLEMRLTRAGRALLRGSSKHVKLTIKGKFTPRSGRAVSLTRKISLAR